MADPVVTFAELCDANVLEVGAGRPRSAGSDLPVLRVADVVDGRIQPTLRAGVSTAYRPEMGPKTSKPGDVALTTKGTVGRVAIIPLGGPTFAYSPQLCYFRTVDNGPLLSRYLYYWFQSAEFWGQADALKAQTDMADFISLRDIMSLALTLPEVAVQRGIAEVLGALDEKIAANNRVISAEAALAESLIERAFSGEVVRLADVASVTMGSSPPGSSYSDVATGLPFYQGVRDFGVRFPSRRVWTDKPVRVAAAGDTLVSVRAPVGRTNLAEEDICIGRGVAALRAKDGHAMTLFHQVRAAHAAWAPYEAEGTVFGAINRAQLEGIELPAVDENKSAEIEARLSEQAAVVAAILRETSVLATARDALLPPLMSGKIGVKDSEKSVEGVLRW